MASTYSDLKIELIGTGDQSGTWGTTTNNNLSTALGEAITGSADVSFSSADVTVTLTDTNAAQTARNLRLNLTGTSGGARNLILGSGCQIEKLYLINNGLADTVTVKNTSGTGIAVPAGKTMFVYNNGTNVVDAMTHATSLTLGSALPITSGGTGTSTAFTTGSVVFAGASGTYTQDNANLFWDDTNNRLGIGTSSPDALLTVNTIASFGDGAVGTPSIAHKGDLNTGLWFPAADTIAASTAGTEHMRITSAGNVGIGATPSALDTLYIAKNITGATTSTAVRAQGVIQNDVTDTARAYQSSITTAAAAFTLTNLTHFQAIQVALGVGSAVTNQYAFNSPSLSTATNNYGFYSNVASATGRWNFYAAGTAANYFAGNIFAGNTTSYPVTISGIAVNPSIQNSGTSANGSALGIYRWQNSSTAAANFALAKSRGTTQGTHVALVSGDETGRVNFHGSDGTSFIPAANISTEVDGTPATNDMPGRLLFSTTPSGSATPTERMRIDNAGRVGIGVTPTSETDIYISGNTTPTTNTFKEGMWLAKTVQSDVTGAYFGFRSRTTTQNAVFTLPHLYNFFVDQAAFGASSTVTNQYGFFAQSTLTGATNNYGFYSNIASATGRWNFYAAGTASNYFAGNVGIGTTSPSTLLDVNGTARTKSYEMADAAGSYTSPTNGYRILASGSDIYLDWFNAGAQIFRTNGGSERMRIDSSGNLLVGKSSASGATAGVQLEPSGLTTLVRSGGVVLQINRLTNDGNLIDFYQDTALEGNISVSGSTVSYNGGHLSRWSQWQNETGKPNVYRGSVLESVDAMCEWEKDGQPLPNEQATKTIVSTTLASKAVAGVFDRYDEDDENNPYDFYVAQSGDFVIRIAQGVTVQNGDLLESAGDGTAKPQADDICRSSTIAKVTSNYVSATYEDGSYCVPCILMIG